MGEDTMLFECFAVKEFFGYENYRVEYTPYNIVPACTVPEACKKPYREYIEYMAGGRDSVTSERNIHIISEPGAEGNMPSSPEFRGTL